MNRQQDQYSKTQNIVRYTLEASAFDWEVQPGKIIRAWGFNGQVPGPVLRARQGDILEVTVKNNLSEPTLVHWHGIRLPASMDGTDDVQRPIRPGDSFTYRFELPDAGTFWYHSHQNETVQMERGLYGGIVVDGDEDLVVDEDRLLLFDDLKLDARNEFRKGNPLSRWIERHDGREGDTALVNGKTHPILHLNAGQRERWRLVNTSSARYLRLSLEGRPFQVIATDGGLLEAPRTETELLLTPGERYDIITPAFQPWEVLSLEALPYDRTTFLRARKRHYATIHVMEEKPSKAFIPRAFRTIVPLASPDAPASRSIRFSVAPSLKRGIDFHVNGGLHHLDEPVHVGELQVWDVQNTSLMDHPFHLHGFFFQVLEENGKAPAYRAWKDTINLKPKSRVRIAWVPDNRPGRWMYHCHILEHHAAGMMAHFDVVDPARPTPMPAPHAHAHHHH